MNGRAMWRCFAMLVISCAVAYAAETPLELTGTVLDISTNAPLADAYVVAIYEEPVRSIGVSTHWCVKVKGMFTGPDGRFSFPVEKLDGESPGQLLAIKPGYYLKRFGGRPDPKAWRRQTREAYQNRILYLQKQDDATPELLRFGGAGVFCYHAQKRADVAGAIQYLQIELAELRKYGDSSQVSKGVESTINTLEELPE